LSVINENKALRAAADSGGKSLSTHTPFRGLLRRYDAFFQGRREGVYWMYTTERMSAEKARVPVGTFCCLAAPMSRLNHGVQSASGVSRTFYA